MNNSLLILSLSYVCLILFIIWASFGKRFSAIQKIIISLLLPAVYFFHWNSLQDIKGWPSDQTLPIQFELLAADIVEPLPNEKRAGNIHLWIRPTDKSRPKAYALPYSRELHKKLFETKKHIAQGSRQIGLLFDSDSGQSGTSIGGGMKLNFRAAPSKRLPPKR